MAESEEELKTLLMKVKESEKPGSKLNIQKWRSWIWSHHFMANRWGNNGNSGRLYFGGLQNHCRWWLQPWNWKTLASCKKNYDKPRQCIKKQRHRFAKKGPSSRSYDFSSSHAQMWELDHKESWAPKNRCFCAVVLENTLESPLDSKEIKPVNPKGNQPWIFIERTDAVTEAPIVWPRDVKSWLTGKEPDAGKDWRQKEKGATEEEMFGWNYWFDGHEFEQTPRGCKELESHGCYNPWGHKESDTTEQLSNDKI